MGAQKSFRYINFTGVVCSVCGVAEQRLLIPDKYSDPYINSMLVLAPLHINSRKSDG
jgi:hypothetical protein